MTATVKLMRLMTLAVLSLGLSACDDNEAVQTSAIQEDIVSAIGVNGYLWRATLDTISALPIAQVDSAGGVIITEWFINPDAPTERLKMTVMITDRALRADAVDVAISRQELVDGVWITAPVRAGTELQIEDAILVQARELRIRALEEEEG
jgi:Domain of unknown function (DUF3576)